MVKPGGEVDSIPATKARIVRGQRRDEKNAVIEWARLKISSPGGLVFAPPLIGGSCAQQLHLLRWTGRLGFDVLSFNYSGHGSSSGKFSLGNSLRNTLTMASGIDRQKEHGNSRLVGFAGCYAAMPLLFAAKRLKEPFESIVLINPLVDLKPFAILRSFVSYYKSIVADGAAKRNVSHALKQYADFLFPHIDKDAEAFGVLKRRRTCLRKVLLDFFLFNPLKSVVLPDTPVLCLYASDDRVLRAHSNRREHYEAEIRRVCPRARFHPVESDHFLSAPRIRRMARDIMASFLSASFEG